MDFWESIDFERTLRDYEFTRRAQRQIHRAVTNETFEDMDAENILRLLKSEFEIVSFKDYLRRYIYERAQLKNRFDQVPEGVYLDIIRNAFEENNVPHSMEPGTTRLAAAIKSWLNSDRVRRDTVFLLGFGLRMEEKDVLEFLTKVLKEDGFREEDPKEAIFRFCYRQGLRFARAREMMRRYDRLRDKTPARAGDDEGTEEEAAFLARLAVQTGSQGGEAASVARRQFLALYARCQAAIAALYNADEAEKPASGRRVWQADDITPADVEQVLCSGIPLSASGNLSPANQSLLNRHFSSYRPSRQRLSVLLSGQQKPDRHDLVTLVFFLHAQQDIQEEERLKNYLDEVNAVLGQSGFGPLNAANPYEAFVLICTLSGCPLALYTEVWELSYPGDQG